MPTGGKIDVEVMYFYRPKDGRVAEWWQLTNADFDYRAKGTEGMPTR